MSSLAGPTVDGRRPRLVLHAPRGPEPVDGVVLVLHGGRSRSTAPTSATQLAVARMLPFAAAASQATHAAGLRVAVARLRYRVRGWNGRRQDPVVDTRWALDALSERFGDVPVVIIGHSMGGRVALALAGDPRVAGVVGLAPWVEPDSRVGDLTGTRIDILHGTADRMTDPIASRGWAEVAQRHGAVVHYTPVAGAGHPMLHRARWWHRTAAAAAVAALQASHRRGVAEYGSAATRQDVDLLGTTTTGRCA